MKYNKKHFELARSFILKGEFRPDVLGFKSIVMGAPGTGKTTSIATLLKMGFKVYGLFTEQGVGNLLKACRSYGCTKEDMDRLYYAYIPPGGSSFSELASSSKTIQQATEFGKIPTPSRRNFGQLIQCINLCNDFVDQHGVSHGSIDALDVDCVFFVDGMSNLAKMAMQLTVGMKPAKTLQDWGVAIDSLENFENQITTIRASFVLLAHIEREVDETSKNIFITVATLGVKYPLRIGRNYHDVILTDNKKGVFSWATISRDCQLKFTYLPAAEQLEPTFEPLVCQWLADYGLVDFTDV